jgi:hypothetical protein
VISVWSVVKNEFALGFPPPHRFSPPARTKIYAIYRAGGGFINQRKDKPHREKDGPQKFRCGMNAGWLFPGDARAPQKNEKISGNDP